MSNPTPRCDINILLKCLKKLTGEIVFSSLSFFISINNVTRTLLIIQEDKTIPTNPKRLKARQSEKNIIACLTFNIDGTYDREEIDLQLPRKKIVYTDVDGLSDYNIPKTEDKIKVTVSGEYEEFKALKKTKKYKSLVKNGIKVVFKPKKLDIKIKEEKMNNLEGTDFKAILNTIVNQEANPYLSQVFELIINGKETKTDDILFL